MGKTTLNIVPINSVVFPHQNIKLYVPSNSIYFKKNMLGCMLGVCFQKNPSKKYSLFSYLTDIGIVIKVTDEVFETNPNTKKQYKMIRGAGLRRFKIKHFLSWLNPHTAEIELLPEETSIEKEGLDMSDTLVVKLKDLAVRYVEQINKEDIMAPSRFEFIRSENNLVKLHYTVASLLKVSDEEKCKLLEINNTKDRIKKLNQILEDELYQGPGHNNPIQPNASKQTTKNLYKPKTPLSYMSEDNQNSQGLSELDTLNKKLQEAELPTQVYEMAQRELDRLRQMEPKDPDFYVQKKYLDILADLPWNRSTDESNDIDAAEEILRRDHAGLENVKKRILEFIAVRMLKKNSKGAILCLQGPPGIGKTSLGRSVADALGKKFGRIALGGVRDEAEIRGHRRTYVGAMPGALVDAILKCGSNNPVILLDEIDKVGSHSVTGDPSAALLEVLDPNQNHTFQDHYLGVPFDLSNVLFIATANNLDTISVPLLDRMEVISLPGYTQFEKVEIAKGYLIPKQIKENGIDASCIDFPESSISYVVKHYTSEAGVRTLERTIGSICRKVAFKFLKSQQKQHEAESFPVTRITEKFIEEALGPKIYDEDIKQRIDQPGIAIGLAWTQVGGRTLLVEAAKAQGKGGIQITGQLGDVMKESVLTAFGWIKSHKEVLSLIASKSEREQLKEMSFSEYDMHIHFPAAAIPKDGPSAGVTIVVALISLLTEVKVRDDVAMTGEISLKGNVLAVGGIKEKCLAAYTNGIKNVILPEENRRNIEEIPKEIRDNIRFFFVKKVAEVLALALDVDIHQEEIKKVVKTGSKTISRSSKL